MKNTAINLFLAISLLLLGYIINTSIYKPTINISKQDSAFNIDNNFLKYTFSSFKLMATDFLWITTLLEADLEQYKNDDLNSWMYLRFDSITNLDPLFLKAYQFGGLYLGIAKDDVIGAASIYEKGLHYYPNDYELVSNAAYLYAFEYKNPQRAIELYEKAVTFSQAPEFYQSILNKLRYSEDQDPQFAFNYLFKVYKNTAEGFFKEKLYNDLYSLKAVIDLECLNNRKENCNHLDFDKEPYPLKNGRYTTRKNISDYKLYK